MPDAIKDVHTIFTLIAAGILITAGGVLAWRALSWPWSDSRVGGGAVLICALIVLVAWLV